MTLSTVSFLGKSIAQTNNLKNLNSELSDLQRQLTSQKKTDSFSGLGTDSKRVQRLRMDADRADVFMRNIDETRTKIDLMDDSMLELAEIAREVVESIVIQTQNGEVEIGAINTVAQEHMKFLSDLLNTEYNGDYLFAGTDVKNRPYDNPATINTNMQVEVANWLNSTQTPTALLNNVAGMTGTDLGYPASLVNAEQVGVRIDTSIEVNYTVMADESGIPDLIRGIALAANLQYPDPATDTATDAEFHQILDEIVTTLNRGIEELDNATFSLASQASLMDSVRDRHFHDKHVFETLTSEIEDADPTEILTRLQTLETQMTASYQATGLIQQLSLVNFI